MSKRTRTIHPVGAAGVHLGESGASWMGMGTREEPAEPLRGFDDRDDLAFGIPESSSYQNRRKPHSGSGILILFGK